MAELNFLPGFSQHLNEEATILYVNTFPPLTQKNKINSNVQDEIKDTTSFLNLL